MFVCIEALMKLSAYAYLDEQKDHHRTLPRIRLATIALLYGVLLVDSVRSEDQQDNRIKREREKRKTKLKLKKKKKKKLKSRC